MEVLNIIDLILKWAVPFLCGGIVAYVNMHRKKELAIEAGVQCLLRAEIIRSHEKYVGRGYCPYHIKESIRREYEAYTRLGGNDVATKCYDDIKKLPENKPDGKE